MNAMGKICFAGINDKYRPEHALRLNATEWGSNVIIHLMSFTALAMPDLLRSPTIDQVGVEERVERLQKRSIKKASKVHALKLGPSMIDLTTLEGADSDGKVKQLCSKAKHLHDTLPDLPHVAAVCVYPTLVRIAKQELKESGIKIAAV